MSVEICVTHSLYIDSDPPAFIGLRKFLDLKEKHVIFISSKYECMQNLGADTTLIITKHIQTKHIKTISIKSKHIKTEYVKVQNISKYKTS